jgi:rhodanese-related sulfurtransferase
MSELASRERSLRSEPSSGASIQRRVGGSAVDDALAAARAELTRVTPEEAARLRTDGALIVDIRPEHDRAAHGEIPGSVPVERIVLEWRLDPTSEHRLPDVTADRTVIVVCNEGYASSLAARDLRRLGLPNATDLAGGFHAWSTAGHPTRPGPSPAVH